MALNQDQEDLLRATRIFAGFASSIVGFNDQNFVGEDQFTVSRQDQYRSINPLDGSVAVQGKPISTLNTGVNAIEPSLLGWLVIGFVAYLALK